MSLSNGDDDGDERPGEATMAMFDVKKGEKGIELLLAAEDVSSSSVSTDVRADGCGRECAIAESPGEGRQTSAAVFEFICLDKS